MRHDAIIIVGRGGAAPDRIGHAAEEVAPPRPRAILERPVALRLSGLEPVELAS
jgi:5-methyltetrahydrofolate--homocysteine methyltransferase